MSGLNVNQQALLALVRASLWSDAVELPEADWEVVEELAKGQGVLWMLYLGTKKYPGQVPAERVRVWRGTMHASVLNNEQINDVQNSVVVWLAQHNIRAAILKGTSCSRYYPYPEARSLGDIDVLVDGANLGAVGAYLESSGFRLGSKDKDIHYEYSGHGCLVEVHYAATKVPDSKGGKVVAGVMTHFLDDLQYVEMAEMRFPMLSPAHQALMLILHMERHMVIGGIGLRQLCDWMMFVDGSGQEHWKNGTLELLKKCGLLTYAKVLTKTCIKYLGLDSSKADWCQKIPDNLVDEMMEDVFRGGSMGHADTESVGNLFIDRMMLGQKNQGKVRGILAYLNKLAYKNWPVTQRAKVLLPFGWAYIPMRYFVRSLLGKRNKIDYTQIFGVSNQREKLYKALDLYEIDNRKG